MRTLKLAFRNVAGSRRGQMGKVVFLGAGLAAGLILLTKVWFEQSYDNFYPDARSIYQIGTVEQDQDGPSEYTYFYTPGGYAPLLAESFPQVESSTRYTVLGWDRQQVFFVGPDRQRLRAKFIYADDSFYDILSRPVVIGDAKDILSRPLYALVSESVAGSIEGDPVGQTLVLDNFPGRSVTIGGIFEDVPNNSIHRYDIVLSMESLPYFEWDGRDNLDGNERYHSFVKLHPGTDVDRLQEMIGEMVASIPEVVEMLENGLDFKVVLIPVNEVHKTDGDTRSTSLVLTILAVAILFATVFNYLLVVISDTVNRGKSIAVMKSYGAGFRSIAASVFAETSIQMAALVATASILLVIFRDSAQQLLGNSLSDLLTWRSGSMIFGIVLLIVLLSTYIQARIYNNIPVATVFRSYRGSGRAVKLGLLFVQIAAAGFLALLLVTVIRQYNAMVGDERGYDYDRLLVSQLTGVTPEQRQTVVSRLELLDVVERVSQASYPPLSGVGGNYVRHPETGYELFHLSDLLYADENYLPLLNIDIIDGEGFRDGVSVPGDVMVNRNFVDTAEDFFDWPDGVIGKDVLMTQHGWVRITGVYEDFKVGNSAYSVIRPTILLYDQTGGNVVLIKMRELGGEAISKVNAVMDEVLPEKEVVVSVYSDMIVRQYSDFLGFRKSITVASFIVMVIVLVGFAGYMRDETIRRQKEIAVRKINGATVADILAVLGRGIMKMMVPALIVGMAAAYFVSMKWMQQFSLKVPFNIFIAVFCAFALAVVGVCAVSLSALNVARKNPAETIKSE